MDRQKERLAVKHLDNPTLKRTDVDRLRPHMVNWLRAHAYIRTLTPTREGIAEAERMLSMELHVMGRRTHMLHRLYGRFSKLRAQYESALVFAHAR